MQFFHSNRTSLHRVDGRKPPLVNLHVCLFLCVCYNTSMANLSFIHTAKLTGVFNCSNVTLAGTTKLAKRSTSFVATFQNTSFSLKEKRIRFFVRLPSGVPPWGQFCHCIKGHWMHFLTCYTNTRGFLHVLSRYFNAGCAAAAGMLVVQWGAGASQEAIWRQWMLNLDVIWD